MNKHFYLFLFILGCSHSSKFTKSTPSMFGYSEDLYIAYQKYVETSEDVLKTFGTEAQPTFRGLECPYKMFVYFNADTGTEFINTRVSVTNVPGFFITCGPAPFNFFEPHTILTQFAPFTYILVERKAGEPKSKSQFNELIGRKILEVGKATRYKWRPLIDKSISPSDTFRIGEVVGFSESGYCMFRFENGQHIENEMKCSSQETKLSIKDFKPSSVIQSIQH